MMTLLAAGFFQAGDFLAFAVEQIMGDLVVDLRLSMRWMLLAVAASWNRRITSMLHALAGLDLAGRAGNAGNPGRCCA